MYYSENAKKKKVKELENDQEFMNYATESFNKSAATFGLDSFEEYLLQEVFNLYDNFSILQFLKASEQSEIDRVLNRALTGLPF